MRELDLPSGAILKITPAPFKDAKALYQAMLVELRHISVPSNGEVGALFKDLFCAGFSSKAVESCLNECFKRCTYNTGAGDFKIDDSSFEPVERREDYMKVCVEVAKDNVGPFGKSLFAEFKQGMSMAEGILKSSQQKTT